MKTLFQRISAIGLLLAALAVPGVGQAAANDTAAPPPAQQQVAWDRVGSPIQPFA